MNDEDLYETFGGKGEGGGRSETMKAHLPRNSHMRALVWQSESNICHLGLRKLRSHSDQAGVRDFGRSVLKVFSASKPWYSW